MSPSSLLLDLEGQLKGALISEGSAQYPEARSEDRVRATYRDNFERLAKVKARYDPDNFFRVNQNVPAAA